MNARIWLVFCLFITAANAADYKPVHCEAAQAYAGAPLLTVGERLPLSMTGDLSGELDEATAQRLHKAFEQAMAATRARSMTVALGVPGRGVWSTEGTAEGGAPSAPLHYWASAGKTLTALTVLRLVEAGRLSLHDPVAKFVSGVPHGNIITVEMLLNHTSGLFSANEDLQARHGKRLSMDETLRILRKHGAMFCPGQQWRYSNSGYDLLGRIIELVEQRPFDQAITAHVVTPLGLKQLRVLTPDDAATDVAPLSSTKPEEPALDPRTPGAAGPLVANAVDVVKFWHAVLTDKVVSRATREDMLARLYPMFGGGMYYGLGVMVYEVPQESGEKQLWIGHSGGAPGVKAVFAYSPQDNAFVAVALSGDGSAEATANLLLHALRAP